MRMKYYDMIRYISEIGTHYNILKVIILHLLSSTEESSSTQLPLDSCFKKTNKRCRTQTRE